MFLKVEGLVVTFLITKHLINLKTYNITWKVVILTHTMDATIVVYEMFVPIMKVAKLFAITC